MSSQEQTPSSSTVRKVEELDNLVNLVRTTARTCLERAGDHTGIFEELKILLEEIASRVSDHCPDTNLDSPVVEKVSSVAALALRTVETDSLNNAIQDCLRSINVWQPFHTSSKSFEKPLPIFGTPAEQDEMVERIEEEKRELAVSEGRIDENERRSAIRDNIKLLLLRLDDVRRSILSCSVDNTTDVENGDTYSITRTHSAGRNDFCYIVRFGNERCVIQGVNAERFVLLCREERVPLEMLGGRDLVASDLSRSTVSHTELSEIQSSRLVSEYQELPPSERTAWLQNLAEGIREVDVRLRAPDLGDADREDLEESRRQIQIILNGANRIPISDRDRMIGTVRTGFTRLAGELRESTPAFANHLESCWNYCALFNQCEYLANEFSWEFCDF